MVTKRPSLGQKCAKRPVIRQRKFEVLQLFSDEAPNESRIFQLRPTPSDQLLSSDLRRLTTLISVAVAFFGMLLLAIIAYAGWSANQTAVDRERRLLDNAFNESILRVLNEQKSVAWWDDPVIKITDDAIDLEFTDANFGVFLTETYGQDEVYILNGENQPLYIRGPNTNGTRPRHSNAAVSRSSLSSKRSGVGMRPASGPDPICSTKPRTATTS